MKKHLEEHLNNPDLFYDPKNPKSECTLQVSGIGLDPDAFLAESNLSQEKEMIKGIIGLPDEIREKIQRKELPDEARERIESGELSKEEFFKVFEIFETPFLLIRISKATEFDLQVEEAILFLRAYLEDLTKLCKYPNVENVLMRFSTEDYDDSKHKNFPDEFNDLCFKIGIQGILC
ncbi:hypothetical protein BH24ACI2_BH24ACI2_12710 [soil metagenome]